MNKMMKLVFLGLCLFITTAQSEIIWVGDSPACDNYSNATHRLDIAILNARQNSDSSDEIRLTRAGMIYTGIGGHYLIENHNSTLTIKGGYSDCGVAINSGPIIGDSDYPVFTVKNSTVTFKNISMKGGTYGLVADSNANVFLDDVDVSVNKAGIEVKGGSYVEIKANSVVRNNTDFNTAKGGGVYCHGNFSKVLIRGKVSGNSAVKGGNIFAETGCDVELTGKSFIIDGHASDAGGGILIDNGGYLWSGGGAELVTIQNNIATNGGGIFVWGTGRVTLLNTFMNNNTATDKGAAIFAANGGGTFSQLVMDRVDDCPFLINCSVIRGSHFNDSLVYVYNSKVNISRTVIDQNYFFAENNYIKGLFRSTDSALLRLDRVAMIRNEAVNLMVNTDNGVIEASHLTAARNQYTLSGNPTKNSWVAAVVARMEIQNSIFTDTSGMDYRSGGLSGKCNLIDNNYDWPAGSYYIGTPQFINVEGGDMRQVASSPGVDMCNQDDFAWSTEKDLENQDAPVNENTNPQGQPGQAGGLFDAGVDEVYDNIGDDMFLLTVQKVGGGNGSVASYPTGIACGSDCTEVYFKGTIVTLYAGASAGSDFIGWQGCPLVDGSGNCLTNMQHSSTIKAIFQPDDLIFENGFE